MRRFGDFELDAWYKLEVNLQRIRRELIKLLESSEANECFVCNKLRCCCPEFSSNRSSTLSCLTSPSCNQSITNQSSSSTNSIEDTPLPPPAYSLPKPEWKAKSVADWIRASTSTPNNDPNMSQDSKNFFIMDETDTEISENMFKTHNISLQQMNTKTHKHGLNYLSKSVPNINEQSYSQANKKKNEVPHHIIMNKYWPKTIWDEMTILAAVNLPINEQQKQNSVQAFFRSFSEVAGGSASNAKGHPKGYSYF